mgnify:FL=1
MNHARRRDVSRRLVIELVLMVLAFGLSTDFPRGVSAGRAWRGVVHDPAVLMHALLGALILVESCVFRARSALSSAAAAAVVAGRCGLLVLAGSGLAFVLLAFGSGLAYTSAGQRDDQLNLMSVGWTGAIVSYGTGWWLGRRGLRAHRRLTPPA